MPWIVGTRKVNWHCSFVPSSYFNKYLSWHPTLLCVVDSIWCLQQEGIKTYLISWHWTYKKVLILEVSCLPFNTRNCKIYWNCIIWIFVHTNAHIYKTKIIKSLNQIYKLVPLSIRHNKDDIWVCNDGPITNLRSAIKLFSFIIKKNN